MSTCNQSVIVSPAARGIICETIGVLASLFVLNIAGLGRLLLTDRFPVFSAAQARGAAAFPPEVNG